MDYIAIVLIGYGTNILVGLIISTFTIYSTFRLNAKEYILLEMKLKKIDTRTHFVKSNLPFYYRLKNKSFIFPFAGILMLIGIMYRSLRERYIDIMIQIAEEELRQLEEDLVKFRNKR